MVKIYNLFLQNSLCTSFIWKWNTFEQWAFLLLNTIGSWVLIHDIVFCGIPDPDTVNSIPKSKQCFLKNLDKKSKRMKVPAFPSFFRMPYFDAWCRVRLENPGTIAILAEDEETKQVLGVAFALLFPRFGLTVGSLTGADTGADSGRRPQPLSLLGGGGATHPPKQKIRCPIFSPFSGFSCSHPSTQD